MISKFQKRGLRILRDIPQIDAFRIPDNVELTEFMEVKITLEINCGAVHGVQVVRVVAA